MQACAPQCFTNLSSVHINDCHSFDLHDITAMELVFIKLQQISICVKLHIQVGVNSKGNYFYCNPLLTQYSHLILLTLYFNSCW